MIIYHAHCRLITVDFLPGLTIEENAEYRQYEHMPFIKLINSPEYTRYRELRDKILQTMPVVLDD
jgi:hypothetical protein